MPIALITGANSGIGLETALLFARNGYRVFAGTRRPDTMRDLQSIVPVRLHVDQDDSVCECVSEVLKQAGAIDVLVNNAGIGLAGPVEMVPLDKVRRLFETNFYGAVRMMQAVLPSMRERRRGTVVNVTSVMGHLTWGCHGFYAATKFALVAVSESLAIEARPFGIRVAIIEPGVVLTPIWNKNDPVDVDATPYRLSMRRLFRHFDAQRDRGTTPDAVARAVLEVVREGCTKLRYTVGADAEAGIATRDRMTPGEWAALLSEEDEDAFLARAESEFGVDLFNPPSANERRRQQHN